MTEGAWWRLGNVSTVDRYSASVGEPTTLRVTGLDDPARYVATTLDGAPSRSTPIEPICGSTGAQAGRNVNTNAALADAAIEVLIEQGWAAVTAVEVCNRVGVTRGAFHHRYDNVPNLLADALQPSTARWSTRPRAHQPISAD